MIIITMMVGDPHTLARDKRATSYDMIWSPQLASNHTLILLAQATVAIQKQFGCAHWIAPFQPNSNPSRVGHRFAFLRESLR